jgi:hypothetical protein
MGVSECLGSFTRFTGGNISFLILLISTRGGVKKPDFFKKYYPVFTFLSNCSTPWAEPKAVDVIRRFGMSSLSLQKSEGFRAKAPRVKPQ